MSKKTILTVDDDPGALECAHAILTRSGYESFPCSGASSALDLLASGAAIDLAIIDLVMPEMNGLEFHARIKHLRPDLPCIVVTGYSSIESYLSALGSGVCEYLNKPYRIWELKTVVAAAFEKSARWRGDALEQIPAGESA